MNLVLPSAKPFKKSLSDVSTCFVLDDLISLEVEALSNVREGLCGLYPNLEPFFELYSVHHLKFFERANILMSYLDVDVFNDSVHKKELGERICEFSGLVFDFYNSFFDGFNEFLKIQHEKGIRELVFNEFSLGEVYKKSVSSFDILRLSDSFWGFYISFLKNVPFRGDYDSFFDDLSIRYGDSLNPMVSYSNNFSLNYFNPNVECDARNLSCERSVFFGCGFEELSFFKSEYHDALTKFRLDLLK